MKPDWSLAPEWAQYVAMDGNGDWFWYESAPRIHVDEEGNPIAWVKAPGSRTEMAVADAALVLPIWTRP